VFRALPRGALISRPRRWAAPALERAELEDQIRRLKA
jgi:hypothetical protein